MQKKGQSITRTIKLNPRNARNAYEALCSICVQGSRKVKIASLYKTHPSSCGRVTQSCVKSNALHCLSVCLPHSACSIPYFANSLYCISSRFFTPEKAAEMPTAGERRQRDRYAEKDVGEAVVWKERWWQGSKVLRCQCRGENSDDKKEGKNTSKCTTKWS